MQKIIGARLRKSREEMGLSQGAFAKAVGISSEYISLLEAGKRTPSFDMLDKIAGFLKKDVSYFLQMREPAFALLLHWEGLDPAARAVFEKFHRYCERYLALEDATGRRLDLAPLYVNVSAENMADEERRRLGLGDEPIRDVFLLCELNGCRVFRASIPESSKVAGVFVFVEERNAAFALVNSAQSLSRQITTAAHLYCHYLKDRPDSPVVDNPDMIVDEYVSLYAPREKFAQTFAAQFLIPPSKVRSIVEKEIGKVRIKFDDVIFLKRYFGASVQAMLRQLRNMGMLRRERFEEYWKQDAEERETAIFGHVSDRGPSARGAAVKDANAAGDDGNGPEPAVSEVREGAAGEKPGSISRLKKGETGYLVADAKLTPMKPVYSDRYKLLLREASLRRKSVSRKEIPPKDEETLEIPLMEEDDDK